ncbi:25948_t:CDS:2, partial [Gigaspora margarita]
MEKATRTYLELTNYHCLPYALYARASYRQAQNEGKSISEISYKSLRKQVKKLLDNFTVREYLSIAQVVFITAPPIPQLTK